MPERFLPEYRKLLTGTFGVTPCSATPEFVQSLALPDSGPSDHNGLTALVREFGEIPGEFTWQSPWSHTPPPLLHELRNVLMVNGIFFSSTGQAFSENVLLHPENGEIAAFRKEPEYNPLPVGNGLFQHARNVQGSAVTIVDEPAMPFYCRSEYGHYLTESLSRLWITELGLRPRLVLEPGLRSVPPFLESMVRAHGFDSASFLIPGEVTFFRQLYLPTPALMLGMYMARPAQAVYRRVAEFYSNSEKKIKIYVSRRFSSKRRLMPEPEHEALFSRLGFSVVYPERLDFADQVRLFSQASHVAGPIGSALHNVLFSLNPDRLRLLIMAPRDFPAMDIFYQLEAAYGRKADCVLGSYLNRESWKVSWWGYFAPWRISGRNLLAAIDQWLQG